MNLSFQNWGTYLHSKKVGYLFCSHFLGLNIHKPVHTRRKQKKENIFEHDQIRNEILLFAKHEGVYTVSKSFEQDIFEKLFWAVSLGWI